MNTPAKRKKTKQLSELLRKYMADDDEDGTPRLKTLIESIYNMATGAEKESVRLAASSFIFDRLEGKVVDRKEVKNLNIEGIVHIPRLEDKPAIPAEAVKL